MLISNTVYFTVALAVERAMLWELLRQLTIFKNLSGKQRTGKFGKTVTQLTNLLHFLSRAICCLQLRSMPYNPIYNH